MHVAHHISYLPAGVEASCCRHVDSMIGANQAPIGGLATLDRGRFLGFVAEVPRLIDCMREF